MANPARPPTTDPHLVAVDDMIDVRVHEAVDRVVGGGDAPSVDTMTTEV